jgi:hypothetical protein
VGSTGSTESSTSSEIKKKKPDGERKVGVVLLTPMTPPAENRENPA